MKKQSKLKVVSMSLFRCRESIAVLEHLLERALKGEIKGLAVCAMPLKGPEEIVFTDQYRRNPSMAASATMRTLLAQIQTEEDDSAFMP